MLFYFKFFMEKQHLMWVLLQGWLFFCMIQYLDNDWNLAIWQSWLKTKITNQIGPDWRQKQSVNHICSKSWLTME